MLTLLSTFFLLHVVNEPKLFFKVSTSNNASAGSIGGLRWHLLGSQTIPASHFVLWTAPSHLITGPSLESPDDCLVTNCRSTLPLAILPLHLPKC